MAVDETMRKLRIPPRFLPYLEYHKVYEIFHDLGNELVISQPKDPLIFIKDFFLNLNKVKNKRLVMLMTPPYLDRIKLAQLLSIKTGYGILSRYLINLTPGDFYDPDALAENTVNFVKDSKKQDWILADYPDTEEEATLLIKAGMIPTHAFLLLPEGAEDPALSCYGEPEEKRDINKKVRSLSATPSMLLEYNHSLYRLQDLFKTSLQIVKIGDKSLEDLADACKYLTLKELPLKMPTLFRVALIGPRGSRRKTIAKILQKKYNLVHVDMLKEINAARVRENDLGDLLRTYDKDNIVYPIKIVFDLLKSRIYQNDCVARGYVLTNFPTSIEDFVVLDSCDTPPNRVIFFNIDRAFCLDRLSNRVVNMWTGRIYSSNEIDSNDKMKSQYLFHPDDEKCKIEEELKFYYERVQSLMDYCGSTGTVINAQGTLKDMLERVESALMKPSLQTSSRAGKLPQKTTILKHELNHGSKSSNEELRKHNSYPLSRTEVVPLIDSDDLMKRYFDLKKGRTTTFIDGKTEIIELTSSSDSITTLKDDLEYKQSNHIDNASVYH